MPDLKQALAGNDVIFIVGTGLSASSTGAAPTSTWSGLIRSGAERACRLNATVTDEWRAMIDQLLELSGPNETIAAAGLVASKLKELGTQAFADWLAEDVGNLRPTSVDAAEALLLYPFPILTTNYDTLLEQISGREGRSWSDVSGFQEIVARASEAIGHLHGVWNDPASVILTESDYAQVTTHASTKALERAISATKTIVYVGFGSGLADPNFSRLLDWQRRTFPESRVSHYRLCLAKDVAALDQEHASDNVKPVAYGDNHSDLAAFLREHAPDRTELSINSAGLALDITQKARNELLSSISQDSVLADVAENAFLQTPIYVTPVLLPLAHAEYVREKLARGRTTEVERVDPGDEVTSHDFFVIAGDEASGLTTTVKWLAANSAEELGTAPIFIRFGDCIARKRPLAVAVQNASRAIGLVRGTTENVPPHVLAIDDFRPSVRTSDAILGEVINGASVVTIIGCKNGDEDALVSKLRLLGVTPRVLYQGRFKRVDIVDLAERIAPGRGVYFADEILKVLNAEGLVRNPFTISLILYLLLQGAAQELSSFTNILDSYATLLLKFGDPHDDPTGFSDADLQALLSNLAEYMIWEERAALSPIEVEGHFDSVIAKYGWGGSGRRALDLLLRRRLLHSHLGEIEFARYSFLTLFAAKRAMVDEELRKRILNDLFYYQPVAIKLASLAPSDEELLIQLSPLLKDAQSLPIDEAAPFEVMAPIEIPLGIDAFKTVEETAEDTPSSDQDVRVAEEDMDLPDPSPKGRFGLVKNEMPVTRQLQRLLHLASALVRDLMQVENLSLKRDALVETLHLYGRYISSMSADPDLADLRHSISQHLLNSDDNFDPEAVETAVDFLIRSIPAGSAMASIEGTLKSPKLNSLLDSAFDAKMLQRDQETLIAAVVLYIVQRPPEWTAKVSALLDASESTWILVHFLRTVLEERYVLDAQSDGAVLDLCKKLIVMGHKFADANHRDQSLRNYATSLGTRRAQRRTSRSGASTEG